MYLIYSKTDGKVWREVHQYERMPNGDIHAGLNGSNTLAYPTAVNVDALEIPDTDFAAMDAGHIGKYRVVDGSVVEDPDWSDSSDTLDMETKQAMEQLRADIDFISIMTGVQL